MSTEAPDRLAAIDEAFRRVSNWGRWGADDQLGTLNFLTDARRRAAAQLVTDGEAVSLGRTVETKPQVDNAFPMQRFMIKSGRDAPDRGHSTASEFITLRAHGFSVTHVDALSHVQWNGQMYNGLPAELVDGVEGAIKLSVDTMATGVTGRGVLLDIPAVQGRPFLDLGEAISLDDLVAAEQAHGVGVQEGDIVLVSTGREARAEELGLQNPTTQGSPGLGLDCADWLHDRGVSVLGSDVVQDVIVANGPWPQLVPVHILALAAMGLPLIDNMYLAPLAEVCQRRGRFDFFFTMAPIQIENATGAPVNPIAIF
jgi:kynurenine formamidase